jgi:hypothetical protein
MLQEARLSESNRQLMLSIGDLIARHTTKSPMPLEEIVGVLAFCAGAAICKGERHFDKRKALRGVAVGNVDQGMDTMAQAVSGTSLIIPGMVN